MIDNDENQESLTVSSFAVAETPTSKPQWDIDKARAAIQSTRERRVGRLPFDEQCAIFAFAYDGMANRYLAAAFHVSTATVAYITGCLLEDPNPTRLAYEPGQDADLEMPRAVPHDHNARRNPNRKRRYWRVAEEFTALGEREFAARYLTPERYRMVRSARRAAILAKGRVPME